MDSFIQNKHEKSLSTTFTAKKLTFFVTFCNFKGIGDNQQLSTAHFNLFSNPNNACIMKNIACCILLIFLLPLSGCQKEVDTLAEEEAIKAVIAAETNAFWDQNLVALLETLIQDDNLIYISIGSNGYR